MPSSNFESLHKGFEEVRIPVADDFQNFVIKSLEEIGFSAFLSSADYRFPEIYEQILPSSGFGSQFIRFFPDIISLVGKPPDVLFAEAKASQTIEKIAWHQYANYAKMGMNLVLVTGKSKNGVCNMSGWNFIENIRLHPGEYTVGKFPEENRYPVIDGWVSPRGSVRFTELQERGNYKMSGAPYREIVSTSLLPWDLFTRIVLARFARKSTF